MSFLDLKNVTKIYPNGTKAVHETSLSIDEGEFMVFVGPSGCGKSTLLRMVAGLEDITEGDINLDGKLMNEVDPSERDVAMVFQNYALYPHMNGYNNLAYGLKNRGIDKETIEQKVNDAANLLQISDYLQRMGVKALYLHSEIDTLENWSGRTGYVHEAVIEDYSDLSDHDVYACGPPPMIDAIVSAFPEHHLREGSLFSDSFEFAKE